MRTVNDWLKLVDSEFQNYVSENYKDFRNGNGWDEVVANIKYNKLESSKVLFELIDSYGGEGQGETYYFVFKITDLENGDFVFIKFDGFYDSWNGTEWQDDPFFVKPIEKTIIVYEK